MQKVLIVALLLSGLFFSFKSVADSVPPYDPEDFKPAIFKESVCAKAANPLGGATKNYACERTQAAAVSKAAPAYAADLTSACATIAGRSSCSVTVNQLLPVSGIPTGAEFDLSYSYKCQKDMTPELEDCAHSEKKYRSVDFQISIIPKSYYCPPTDPSNSAALNLILEKYVLGPYRVDNEERCYKPKKPSTCPTAPDGNNYFHVGQKGGGKVCLENDSGDSCPYKEEGTSGFYTADYSDPTSCQDTPPEPPNDDKDCSPNGAGQQVCNADPDEKCQSKNGLLVCQDGCGFMNGVFKCFKEPPKPEEPEEPEVPDPQIDDSITDPDKPVQDMTKADLKSTYRGIETRLESTKKELEDVQKKNDQNAKGIISAINNVGRKVDKTNENLESAFKGEKFDEKGLADEADIKAGLGITGSEKITDLKNGEISIDSFKSSFAPFLSSGQCPPPRSISVYGKSYQLDWDPFCQFFTALGYLVMATAYILVPFIVFGGKK